MLRVLSKAVFLIAILALPFAVNSSAYTGYIPDDPDFMCAQSDNPYPENYDPKSWLFDEQYGLFSFAPEQSAKTAVYKDKGRSGLPQVSGVSADMAWTLELGDASVSIAILDTGAKWDEDDLINRYVLNSAELPPAGWDPIKGPVCDVNGDGATTVEDYAEFFRKDCGGQEGCLSIPDSNGNGRLDPQDMIRAFSNGYDEDGNGFTDDICGWDFFEDDNDPEDTSSYFAARFHGPDMSKNAAAEHDNSNGGSGICPHCTILPLKTWNSFLQNADYYGIASIYAAMMKASVVEGACGVINNSGISRDAIRFAYDSGLAFFLVSSDMNSANHNFPTYLNEPIYCAGTVPDTYPVPGIPPTSYFRNSNLTQYGGKAMICFAADSGSNATSMSSGAGGLIISHARRLARKGLIDKALHPDQVKQIITLSAEDVLPENTGSIGTPDPSQYGWDQHFGYGRVNVFDAVSMVEELDLPPVARITAPSWFAYLNPVSDRLEIRGDILPAAEGTVEWTLEAGIGIEPAEPGHARNAQEQAKQFRTIISTGIATGRNILIAEIDLSKIKKMFPSSIDITKGPSGTDPLNLFEADIQPNRNAFTIRLRVSQNAGGRLTAAEDRRVFMLVEDSTLHTGWPKYIGAGGDESPRFEDLDGDNLKEVILATADGRILIYKHDGSPYEVNGRAVEFTSKTFSLAVNHNIRIAGADLRPSFTTPSIADIDNDGIKEIAAASGTSLYCFKADGRQQFEPVDFGGSFRNQARSGLLTENNAIGPGAMAAPVLFDIDRDGFKEIILSSFDQNIYVWDHKGNIENGWPVRARSDGADGAMIIHPPSIADINGDGISEIVASSNEVRPSSKKLRLGDFITAGKVPKALLPFILTIVNSFIGKDCMIYALNPGGNGDPKGKFVSGWPAGVTSLMPDMLPQVGPSAKTCAFDADGDGAYEIVASAVTSSVGIIDGTGKLLREMDLSPFGKNTSDLRDRTLAIGMLDSPCLGDINGDGVPEIAKTGITTLGAANMGLAGQNLSYNHVISVWNSKTGKYLDSFPRPTDDILFYSEPAMADVSGDGIPDVIVGTGLYLLHAYAGDGREIEGFPKQTGGWICTTPAIDDIDGDGLNEAATVTRDGWVFVWDTAGKQDKVASWPTYGHDNFTTSNISTDATPPAAVTEFAMTADGLEFIAPGDDGFAGKPASMRLYGSDIPIDVYTFSKASFIKDIVPVSGGTLLAINPDHAYKYYAVIAADEAGNSSQLPLNASSETVKPEDSGQSGGEAGDDGGSSGLCFMGTSFL